MKKILLAILILGLLTACGNGGIGEFFSGLFSSSDDNKSAERPPAQVVKPADNGEAPEMKETKTLNAKPAQTASAESAAAAPDKAAAQTSPEKTQKTASETSSTQKKTAAASPAPEKKPESEKTEAVQAYQYKDHGKKDPFLLPADTVKDKSGKLTSGLAGSQEGEVDFSKFTFKATIKYGVESVAVLEDSGGKGIILRVGEVFGGAKVISITSEKIVLRRLTLKSEDQSREIVLQRVKPEGGNQ
ncbi:MAG TPA: hypothetical protein ENN72_07890 [Firmicutes bacterium]|nr:hypothetical protein [Bacillota bacterium]